MENNGDRIFEALLRVAAEEAMKQEIDEMPSCEELDKLYVPSPALNKRIYKLIKNSERKTKTKIFIKGFAKVAAAFGLFITAAFTVLLSVEASRNFIFNAIVNLQEDHVSFEFTEKSASIDGDTYILGYLPTGFELIGAHSTENTGTRIYTNEEDIQILFQYQMAESSAISADSELKDYAVIKINQTTAYLFSSNVIGGNNALVWQSQNTVFTLASSIDTDELIAIAESVHKK